MTFCHASDRRAKPIADGDKVVPDRSFSDLTIVVGRVPADLWKPFDS